MKMIDPNSMAMIHFHLYHLLQKRMERIGVFVVEVVFE